MTARIRVADPLINHCARWAALIARSLIEVATVLAGAASSGSAISAICTAWLAISVEGVGAFRAAAQARLIEQVVA